MKIGENVQIDHMVRTLNDCIYTEPFVKANNKNAAIFLKNLMEKPPFH